MLKRTLKKVAVGSHRQFINGNNQDHYFDLHKECVAMKRKLQRTKKKRDILKAEVEFLRKRHKFLMETHSHQPQQLDSSSQHDAIQKPDDQPKTNNNKNTANQHGGGFDTM